MSRPKNTGPVVCTALGDQRFDIRHLVARQAGRIRDVRRGLTVLHALDDLGDSGRCQIGEYDIVDQHRRFMVAQSDARGFEQSEISRAWRAEPCSGRVFQGGIHLAVAARLGDDVVAQIDAMAARRCGVEEMVKRHRLQNVSDCQPEPFGYPGSGFSRNVAVLAVYIPEDVDEPGAVSRVPVENRRDIGRHAPPYSSSKPGGKVTMAELLLRCRIVVFAANRGDIVISSSDLRSGQGIDFNSTQPRF